MIATRSVCAAALLFLLWAVPQSFGQGQGSSEVEQGKRLYEGMCITCHGYDGAGGQAPSLNRPRLDRAPDDTALRSVIAEGIPSRGMPRVRRVTENELRQLVSYVRSLGRTPRAPLAGDAGRGSGIYNRMGCASCHIVNGQGGSLGPPLTDIGATRGPEHLRQALVEPGASLPSGTLPVPARGLTEFLPMRVVTLDGREVRGIRINEDTFTLQLRDAGNQFHSFRKSDLRQIEKETGKSLMPGYKDRLTASELDDLTAYLSSLRGAK